MELPKWIEELEQQALKEIKVIQAPKWVDEFIEEITRYQKVIDETNEENYIELIHLKAGMFKYIGKVAARLAEEYKTIYTVRKRIKAITYIQAGKGKEAVSEIAVQNIRLIESKAYGDMKRWNNAFESTQEEINALKYKQRKDEV